MSVLSVARAAAEAPGEPALWWQGRLYSWAELAELSARAGRGLDLRGVRPGDRVCVRASNRLEVVAAALALLERGAALVPLHPRLTEREAADLEALAEPALALDDQGASALLDGPPGAARASAEPADDALLAMLFTSGTTGRPKGAMLSRRAFVAAARASEQNLGWRPGDRWLLAMPVCHVGGLSIVTRCLIARRCVVLLPRFEPLAVLSAIDEARVSLLSVVPTMLHALLEADRDNRLARLRAVLVGGAACPRVLLEECARRGVLSLTTYGLTEACSQVTSQRPRDGRLFEPGSGHPLPGTTVQIVSEAGEGEGGEGAQVLPAGSVGIIRVASPSLMDGYLGGPRLGGWLDTGDLGELDETGRLFVHARRTDLIVTGGENVYPAEIEQALVSLPGVEQACVFGVPDERWGQLVACAIVPRGEVNEEVLAAGITSALAPHKRPRRWCFVAALPTKGPGKIDRAGAARGFGGQVKPVPSG